MENQPRNTLLAEFYAAPPDALFTEKVVALVRGCSVALLQRDRWAKTGIPYHRIGRNIFYKQRDVMDYINRHHVVPGRNTQG